MIKKPNKIIILLVSLLIVIGFLGFGLWRGDTTQQAYAGDRREPQLFGWAWTETIGWISMNCFDVEGDYCADDHDYGVSVNQSTGKLQGYAWSENVGWISFNPAEDLNYPYKNTPEDPTIKCVDVSGNGIDCADGSCTACYNFTNHHLYGWAHVVSLGDDGWIRLDNPVVDSQEWGVKEDNSSDEDNGDFYGWAWNGNDTPKTGIGWMSWNGLNDGGDYRVDGNPRKLIITSVERTKGEESHSLTVKWNGDVYGETKFYVYRKKDGEATFEKVFYKDGSEIFLAQDKFDFADGSRFFPKSPPEKIPLDLDEGYSYQIKACNMFGCTSAESASKKTSPIMAIPEIKINTTCDQASASFVLEWVDTLSLVPISYYEGQYCVAKAGQTADDCKEWIHAFVDKILNPEDIKPFQSRRNYTDVMNSERYRLDKFNNHFYRIRAVSKKNGDYPTDDECEDENGCDDIGSWAYTIRPVRPCVPPTQPKYQEVRPK